MQKSWKRSDASVGLETRTTYPRRSPVPLPEVVSIDVLGTMLDEDLVVRLRALDEDRMKAYEMHLEMRPWEEEIAYVRREQQIRRLRRDAHAEYVKHGEDDFNRAEATLPAGDFDNSVFVFAASGGRPRWN